MTPNDLEWWSRDPNQYYDKGAYSELKRMGREYKRNNYYELSKGSVTEFVLYGIMLIGIIFMVLSLLTEGNKEIGSLIIGLVFVVPGFIHICIRVRRAH